MDEKLNRKKPKIKFISVGNCPQCGKELIRDAECDVAVCTCKSAVKVNLTSAVILSPKLKKFFEGYAKKFNCTVDEVFAVSISMGLKKVKKMGIVEFLSKRSEVKQ